MNIHVVEDSELDRRILIQALENLGHVVTSTKDGADAFTHLDASEDRVVICDWKMPRMDGIELCKAIRADTSRPYLYFILLTGADINERNEEMASIAGVDDFLPKPIIEHELWRRLRVAERIITYTTEVQQLESMLPICAHCKSIRDDKNYWNSVEEFMSSKAGVRFSHGICPACMDKHWPEASRMLQARKVAKESSERASP